MFVLITLAAASALRVSTSGKRHYPDFWTALRYAASISCRSRPPPATASTDFDLWPIFAPMWMLFLCCFASCSGSTGGGIKMIRALILYRQVDARNA